MGTPSPKKSNIGWYIAAIVIIIIIVVVGVLAYQASRPGPSASPSPSASASPTASATPSPSVTSTPSPTATGATVKIDIYAGELTLSSYGFGLSANSITSNPGPSLSFKVGDTVTVTFHNGGTMFHNWALVTQKSDGNTNLAFANSQIASGSSAVSPGGTASTTFTVDKAGTFYYICQVDAHVSLGMWGTVTVTG